MSIGKNTRFACVAFGLVALFAAAQAVPKAVIYWRYVDQAFWVDALRFGCIGFTMALGLAMLLPHRSLPWVVRQAESPGGGGFWIGAGVAFLPIVGTLGLSGRTWVTLVALVLYGIVVFSVGRVLAKRRPPRTEAPERQPFDARDKSRFAGQEIASWHSVYRVFLAVGALMWFVGGIAFIFGGSTATTPLWSRVSLGAGLAIAVSMAAMFTVAMVRNMRADERKGSPGHTA